MISIFQIFNYKVCPILDASLNKAMESGILDISTDDDYYVNIRFKDGSELYAWNVNRFHGWLNEGYFKYPISERKYCWQDARPKRKTMNKLIKLLNNFEYIV